MKCTFFAAVFLPIIAFLYAVICFIPSTEDIAKMLGSALVPGSPHANMYFAMYAYNSTEQGRSFTRDLKIGQYVKVRDRGGGSYILEPLMALAWVMYDGDRDVLT